jgi:hypothetical protein
MGGRTVDHRRQDDAAAAGAQARWSGAAATQAARRAATGTRRSGWAPRRARGGGFVGSAGGLAVRRPLRWRGPALHRIGPTRCGHRIGAAGGVEVESAQVVAEGAPKVRRRRANSACLEEAELVAGV